MSSSEISLARAIKTLLADEALSDITLEGTDGITVPAFRRFISARSRVFRRMLCGDFVESERDKIQLGYTGGVLRAVVEYCYTDDSVVFKNAVSDSQARILVDLSAAADYFELPLLSKRACGAARELMTERPSLACVVLDQAYDRGKMLSTLANDALRFIRKDPERALLPVDGFGVSSLRPETLADVISDEQMNCEEITLFRALKSWAELGEEGDYESRHAIAVEIGQSIRLHYIGPTDLVAFVEESKLVTRDQLFEAFKMQAMQAERDNKKFARPRFFCGWKSSNEALYTNQSGAHTTEMLECEGMTEGVHMWSIEITSYCNCVWIGVACTTANINCEEWLGKQNGGWAYGSNGAACHATGMDNGPYEEIYPSFLQGSVITLTLDLTGCGTITTQVADKEPVMIFEDLIVDMQKYDKPAFVPAVSLRSPGAVRLLNFGACKF